MKKNIDVIKKAKNLRTLGQTLDEITRQLQRPRRTVYEWIKNVRLSPQANQRIESKKQLRQNNFIVQGNLATVASYLQRRKNSYDKAFSLALDDIDKVMVGLYLGEGNKSKELWGFVNSDPNIIKWALLWLHKYNQNDCTAHVQIHPEDSITEKEVKDFWSYLGLKKEKIKVYRNRTKTSKKIVKRKTPYGTCSLRPHQGARLFEIFRAQRDKLFKIDNVTSSC